MSKDWWGDDDKCGECIYNKMTTGKSIMYALIGKVKIMDL